MVTPYKKFGLPEKKSGMTLLEIMIGVGILGLITLATIAFQKDFFTLNRLTEGKLNREYQIRKALKNLNKEIRSAAPSSIGGFTIEQATDNSFIFFANIDHDNLTERLRYFLDGTLLKKGVIKPTGAPLVYNPANEALANLTEDVVGPAGLFSYYDASYDGTGLPLTQPVDVSKIRMVKITISVDPNGPQPPAPVTFTSQNTVRNLKN